MNTTSLLAVSALALTAAACAPKTPPARAALDCPSEQGDLKRTSVAQDGKACTYVADDGAEVTLQLVAVQGGVDATLARLEDQIVPAGVETAEGGSTGEAGEAKPAEVVAGPSEAARKAAAEAAADAHAAPGVKVEKDGKTVVDIHGDAGVTEDEHGTTHVNLPGIHITANDDDDTADVQIGPLRVNAGGDGATVRMRREVRLRGEAFSPEKRGVRATFIYTGSSLPDGYRYVGYEAGGPKAGPLTVAVVKSKSHGPDGGELYPDVKRLVRKNGGV